MMDQEVWTITNTEYLKTNVLLTTKVDALVPKSVTTGNSISLSLSAGTKVLGIPVDVGFSYSVNYSITGPGNSVPLAGNTANGYLTHYAPVGYTKGDIIRYTYRVTDQYSGAYLRTEIRTVASRKEGGYYTIGVQSATNFKAENTTGTNYKTYTNYTDYVNKISTLDSSYLYF